MREYTPFYMNDTTFLWEPVEKGQIESWTNPGYPHEIKIEGVLVHGKPVCDMLQSLILDHHEVTITREILYFIQEEAA